jgi:murein DD-endopeptidase MepM/ murein hydrolase activator NlpD
MNKVYNGPALYGILLMLAGCAQVQPAPVVGGYQKSNQVMGVGQQVSENSGFSMTREVSSKAGDGSNSGAGSSSSAAIQTAPSTLKEEQLQSISPAAGPSAKAAKPAAVEASALPEKRSLVDDWTKNDQVSQGVTSHTVQPGETVYRLARRYNTTPAEIVKLNHMDSTADLASGQTVNIPTGTKAPVAELALNRRTTGALVTHSVAQPAQIDAQVAQVGTKPAQKPIQTAAATPPRLLLPVSGPTGQGAHAEVVAPVVAAKPAEAGVQMAEETDAKVAGIEPAAGPARKIDPKAEAKPSGVKVITHTVAKGETVYRIAHQYGASVLDVMSANNFSQPQQLKSGMVVKVPVSQGPAGSGVVAEGGSNSTSPAPTKVVARDEDETMEAKPVPAKTAVDEVKAAFNKGKIDPLAARSKGLAWPVHGQVIRKFGSEGNGVAHAGINIAVPPNTPVLATDSGTVLYSGSGLKTYGNLVILRHADGMVSAYANNNQLLVAKGESVKKGQVIALSGASGNVDKPQLHFELRRNAGAVDPMTLLASQ